MSDTIYVGDEIVVGTFCGPGEPGASGRRRWQFTTFRPDGIAVLDDDELATLLDALERKLYGVTLGESLACTRRIAKALGWTEIAETLKPGDHSRRIA